MNVEPFEQLAARYDRWFDRHPWVYQSELAAIRRLLPKRGRGIEIGVGTGRFAVPLGINLGIEPARAMATIARARGIDTIGATAEALPFKNDAFDFTLFVTTICFLTDIAAALREARRVLRIHGAIVIGFIDRDSPPGRRYEQYKRKSPFYQGAQFRSAKEVRSLLTRAGFGGLAFVQTVFHDPGEVAAVEPAKEGHGEGAFVVVRGAKATAI